MLRHCLHLLAQFVLEGLRPFKFRQQALLLIRLQHFVIEELLTLLCQLLDLLAHLAELALGLATVGLRLACFEHRAIRLDRQLHFFFDLRHLTRKVLLLRSQLLRQLYLIVKFSFDLLELGENVADGVNFRTQVLFILIVLITASSLG